MTTYQVYTKATNGNTSATTDYGLIETREQLLPKMEAARAEGHEWIYLLPLGGTKASKIKLTEEA